MNIILVAIVLCYGIIQFLELGALLGRIAGVKKNSVVLGYSIQQSVYMVTRLFVIALLPLIGFIIDLGISEEKFAIIAHLSLLMATILGLFSIYMVKPIIGYYSGVIERYKYGGNFIRAFWGRSSNVIDFYQPSINEILLKKETMTTLIQANLVFFIYSSGIFISFYLALIFHDYRASISQMSGVINALGAVILTLVIEPKISRSIDAQEESAVLHIFALYWGRLLATAVTGQVFLFLVFRVSY